METDTYLTIARPAEGNYKAKGSKFFAYAFPVDNEDEAKNYLTLIRKKHADAGHHCYAFNIGLINPQSRASDDGEPSYSAGKPIFGQILSKELTNILIIVVRYFGGTLLGVGGLISAYRNSASEALSKATIIEKTIDQTFQITFDFMAMNDVMRLMKNEKLREISRNFSLNGQLTFAVRKSNAQRIFDSFEAIEHLNIIKL